MAATAENDHLPASDENGSSNLAAGEQSEQKKESTGDSITVFHDPENFNVKHPLMNDWTLWFTKPPSGKVRVLWIHFINNKPHPDSIRVRTSTGMIF
jgi:translation initiation factor 4E